MGRDRAVADAFLKNIAFSPSVQTALVLHLESLAGAENRPSFVRPAAEQCESEGDALFFAHTARLLSELNANGRTIEKLETLGSLPLAIGADGTLIAALEWDYAVWTQDAANFVAQLLPIAEWR
jgi:hypothetical protein